MMEQHKDLSIPELIPILQNLISKGNIVHVKFTCPNPKCGSRQTSQDANSLHVKPSADVPYDEMVGEYTCSECNKLVEVKKFGFMLITGVKI